MRSLEREQTPAHTIQEEPIVRNDHRRAREAVQIVLKNRKRLDVQIVRRLVEQQYVGREHQHAAKIQPPPLAAGEPAHLGILLLRGKRKLSSICEALSFPSGVCTYSAMERM